MTSSANDYSIYHIDRYGVLVEKLDETDGGAAECRESADNVRAMMKTASIKSALDQMTAEYVEHFMAAWFLIDGKGTDKERKEKVSRDFVEMMIILHQFPALCLSDRLRLLDVTGATRRFLWQTVFRLYARRIVLDRGRSQQMLDLKTRSGSAGDKEGHILNAYRTIKFQFVVTILHEIGHIFITHLGEGQDKTPPSRSDEPGEAGFRLEELVFGGRLSFLRDKRRLESDHGAGYVFMSKEDSEEGLKWFSVAKEAIDSTLDMNFQFPFKDEWLTPLEPGERNKYLRNMEKGENEPRESEDPALHPDWDKRLKEIDPEGYERFKRF